MSLTVFLALCVLGVDFMIYFFFKIVYGEKHRIRPRRLPADYYRRKEQTSPLYLVPARKNRLAEAGPGTRLRRSNSSWTSGTRKNEIA
jgi:hypothetical protein